MRGVGSAVTVNLKLSKLPDRSPVKLAITISPDLQTALQAYAAKYGVEEPVAELATAMLAAFLEGDRNFMRTRVAALQGCP